MAGSPRCRPFSQEVGAGLCGHQCSETRHLSVRPRPGPAAEDSNGSGIPASLPPTHMGSAQPIPLPGQHPSANIPWTHPGDHTAIEAGQLGVIIGDLLLHDPVGRQCCETTRRRAGSHQRALGGRRPHTLSQGACQPRLSSRMPRHQSVWMPLPQQCDLGTLVTLLWTPPRAQVRRRSKPLTLEWQRVTSSRL